MSGFIAISKAYVVMVLTGTEHSFGMLADELGEHMSMLFVSSRVVFFHNNVTHVNYFDIYVYLYIYVFTNCTSLAIFRKFSIHRFR